MRFLLRISGLIDAVNDGIGKLVYWLVLAAVLVSSVNAVVRYTFNTSSNAWLELQWYLFAAIFLLCSGYTLLRNEHIRIDIIVGRFSKRVQAAVDIFGILFFLFPMAILIMWLSWPMFMDSFRTNEMSSDAGGLIRWPAKLLVPVGFFLLSAQGVSELIKRIAFLAGAIDQPGEKMHSH
ncbi:TRAP transporter small permease subunit [Azospirillum soli]|uniref:TRAP transporter small permease subunit n=1 Tax=Azospirillum soli TaxID=1304799 RepID=UPI001AE74C58|nr:TRAP transporter small permease subunit [Azospirillum soli]MBP2314751.1 TRAP-type mannitol/chloroaromatic compound transport system permease small subunit [Azospirillum soli]